MYGIDVIAESQNYNLSINGKLCLAFSNPVDNKNDSWSVTGNSGAELTFKRTMVDKHKDQMGFAVLRIPTSEIKLGDLRPTRDFNYVWTYTGVVFQ